MWAPGALLHPQAEPLLGESPLKVMVFQELGLVPQPEPVLCRVGEEQVGNRAGGVPSAQFSGHEPQRTALT